MKISGATGFFGFQTPSIMPRYVRLPSYIFFLMFQLCSAKDLQIDSREKTELNSLCAVTLKNMASSEEPLQLTVVAQFFKGFVAIAVIIISA